MLIIIDNGSYSHHNHGDNAMLVGALERLTRRWPSADMHVITSDPDRLFKLYPRATALNAHDFESWWRRRSGINRTSRAMIRRIVTPAARVGGARRFASVLSRADLVVATGGGYLRDRFRDHAFATLTLMDCASSQSIPTAMFSQGPGSLSGDLESLAREVIPRIDLITVRQRLTAPRLFQSWGALSERVVMAGDDAMGLAGNLDPECTQGGIGVNLRVNMHSSIGEATLRSCREVLARIVNEENTHLVPVPISFSKSNRDEIICERLGAELPMDDVAGVLRKTFSTPFDVLRNVKNCRVVLTGSYHGAVFALSNGVPAVCVVNSTYYEDKFGGIADLYPQGCAIVSTNGAGFVERLQHSLTKYYRSSDLLTTDLIETTNNYIRESERSFSVLAEIIEAKVSPDSQQRLVE